jgi:hypothetical protein
MCSAAEELTPKLSVRDQDRCAPRQDAGAPTVDEDTRTGAKN